MICSSRNFEREREMFTSMEVVVAKTLAVEVEVDRFERDLKFSYLT